MVLPVVLLLRRPLHLLVTRLGDDTLLLVLSVLLPLVGGMVFEYAGYGAEFGAILLGALLADHPRAERLQRLLWNLKEVLLIGFFVNVGMIAFPGDADASTLAFAAVALLLVLPLKAVVFFLLLVGFGLRPRTAFLAGATLTSYSEFTLMAGLMSVF